MPYLQAFENIHDSLPANICYIWYKQKNNTVFFLPHKKLRLNQEG